VTNSVRRIWLIGVGNEIAHLDIVTEGLESVGKSLWNVELVSVVARKLKLLPMPIGRGVGPYVNDDVPNRSLDTTHQLGLGMRFALKMHSSQRAPVSRERDAVLGIAEFKSPRSEFFNAKIAREEAAAITHRLQTDEPGVTQFSRVK